MCGGAVSDRGVQMDFIGKVLDNQSSKILYTRLVAFLGNPGYIKNLERFLCKIKLGSRLTKL